MSQKPILLFDILLFLNIAVSSSRLCKRLTTGKELKGIGGSPAQSAETLSPQHVAECWHFEHALVNLALVFFSR